MESEHAPEKSGESREPRSYDPTSSASSGDTAALLRRYFEHGDREALDRVFARCYPLVERIVRIRLGSRLRQRIEVSDVLQDTMLRALQRLHRFEPREDARLIHWLAKVAEREIVRHSRSEGAQKRERGREVRLEALQGSAEDSSFRFDPEADSTAVIERVESLEMEAIVDACLAELSVKHREVILLREYEGGDWRHVSERLGRVSEEAARKLYDRAREALRLCVRRRVRFDG